MSDALDSVSQGAPGDVMTSTPIVRAAPAHARRNRLLNWAVYHLGWPGVVALAACMTAAVLASFVIPSLHRRGQAIEVEQLKTVQQRDAAPRRRLDPRAEWLERLPTDEAAGQNIAKLLQVARESGVQVERADYTDEMIEPGMLRIKVRMPVAGSYVQVRAFMAGVLNGLSNASIDAVEIERPQQANSASELQAKFLIGLLFKRKDS